MDRNLKREAEEIELVCQIRDKLGFMGAPAELFLQLPQQAAHSNK
ncbi:hypothetical protein [Microcoleus sp. B5-D4]